MIENCVDRVQLLEFEVRYINAYREYILLAKFQ